MLSFLLYLLLMNSPVDWPRSPSVGMHVAPDGAQHTLRMRLDQTGGCQKYAQPRRLTRLSRTRSLRDSLFSCGAGRNHKDRREAGVAPPRVSAAGEPVVCNKFRAESTRAHGSAIELQKKALEDKEYAADDRPLIGAKDAAARIAAWEKGELWTTKRR